VEAIIEPLRSLDWEDADAVEHACRKALTTLTDDPGTIRQALLGLPERLKQTTGPARSIDIYQP